MIQFLYFLKPSKEKSQHLPAFSMNFKGGIIACSWKHNRAH